MNTISDTLKKRILEIDAELAITESSITSAEETLTKSKAQKALLEAEKNKINNFLTKGSELDAIFSN